MIDLSKFSEEKIEQIIKDRLETLEANAIKTTEIGNVERLDENASHHKGFISRDTKVCYSMGYGYYMKTTDYIRDFIDYIRQNNIPPSPQNIFNFLNNYFGERPSTDVDMRNEKDFKDISDFKNSNCAVCTERAAVANNILSFLGMESWFCDGSVYDSGNLKCENHAFVIVKTEAGKYRVYDPSFSITYENSDHPFMRNISEDSATRLLNSTPINPSKRNCVRVNGYYPAVVDGKRRMVDDNFYRMYGVGIAKEELLDLVEERDER